VLNGGFPARAPRSYRWVAPGLRPREFPVFCPQGARWSSFELARHTIHDRTIRVRLRTSGQSPYEPIERSSEREPVSGCDPSVSRSSRSPSFPTSTGSPKARPTCRRRSRLDERAPRTSTFWSRLLGRSASLSRSECPRRAGRAGRRALDWIDPSARTTSVWSPSLRDISPRAVFDANAPRYWMQRT